MHHDRLLVVSVLGLLVNIFGIFVFHGHAHGHSHGGGSHGHSHLGDMFSSGIVLDFSIMREFSRLYIF